MLRLHPSVVAAVRTSVPIVDIIKKHVDLKEIGGGEWMGLCPFHDDQNPSMSVNAEKGLYNCFACGAKGQTIDFVSEVEGLTFKESVTKLAEEYGIPLALAGDGDIPFIPQNYSRLHTALETAAEWYSAMMMEASGGGARSHLRQRRIGPDMASAFQLGYSPVQPGALLSHLIDEGFTLDEVVQAGIFSKAALGRGIDRMMGRLIIPIRNSRGQIVALSGRLLDDSPALAKYINSPDSPIFKKRSVLFGLPQAKAAIKEEGIAVVVEGYFDVVALHSAGVRCAVATMGTGLQLDNLLALRSILPPHGTIIIAYDRDKAGKQAIERLCSGVLLSMDVDERFSGIGVKVASLPPQGDIKDPADFIMAQGAQGGEAYRKKVLDKAVSWKQWYAVELIKDFDNGAAEAMDMSAFSRASEALTDFLSRLSVDKPADRTYLCDILAKRASKDGVQQDRLLKDLIEQSELKRLRRQKGIAAFRQDAVVALLPPAADRSTSTNGQPAAARIPSPVQSAPTGPPSIAAAHGDQRDRELDQAAVAEAEMLVLRTAIRDGALREAMRGLVEGEQLMLSSKAHQALFTWVVQSGRVPAEASVTQIRNSFERRFPDFRGLLHYFDDNGGADQQVLRQISVRDALQLIVKASVQRMALAEEQLWSYKLQKLKANGLPSESSDSLQSPMLSRAPPRRSESPMSRNEQIQSQKATSKWAKERQRWRRVS